MPCNACPVKDGACLGETSHRMFCAWAASGDPIKAQHIIARPGMPVALEAQPPSLLDKAVNLAVALFEHVAAGMPLVDAETAEARLAICRTCLEFFDAERVVCTHKKCGCQMEVKITWAEQACPIGKWPAVISPS